MSTLTDHLQLVKPESIENVSVTVLNKNFDTIDDEIHKVQTDYIIATGEQNGWMYRRWASGICECWGTVNVKNANGFAAGGAFTLPITLDTVDSVIATVGNGGFSNSYSSLGINAKAWVNNSTLTVWANSRDGAFNQYNPVPVSVEIRGREKKG